MRYLANAFSLQMITGDHQVSIKTMPGGLEAFAKAFKKIPFDLIAIGHADLAAVVSKAVGVEIPQNRANIALKPNDALYVVQVVGGRLPEGCTTLPEGIQIEIKVVTVEDKLQPWDQENFRISSSDASIYGNMLKLGEIVATHFNDVEVKPMADGHNNFIVEISGLGFYGTIWDD